MAISSTVAKQLCTKAEFELFSQSLARNIKSLDAKALRSGVTRSRKLRDKYRGLAHRQDRESRGKQKAKRSRPSQGSSATRKKEQLFAESLSRFEKQLAAAIKPKKKAVKKSTAKKAVKKTAKKAVNKKTPTKKTTKKKSVAKAKRPAAKKVALKKKVAKKKAVKKKRVTASARGKKATTAAKKARQAAAGRMRIDKHISAQGRRNQAKRDRR
ncbi:MAG: hypothetical protein MI757_11580 [Pirellulales bacterium]|nr:hypothetical protein [Pirellulales bacterium]